MAWYKTLTEKAFFVIIFALISIFQIGSMLGFNQDNKLVETAIKAGISTLVAILLSFIIFKAHESDVET